MKHLFCLVIACFLGFNASTNAATQSWEVSGLNALYLDALNHSVEILPAGDNRIEWQGEGPAPRFSRGALQAAELKFDENGVGRHRVKVPSHLLLHISAREGAIEIRQHRAEVSAQTVNGDIRVIQQRGKSRLLSVNGDIHLEQAEGQHELETVNGIVQVSASAGPLSVKNVSGEIQLQTQVAQLSASNMNGTFSGELTQVSKLNLSSVSGKVALRISPVENASIAIDTVSGDVDVQFPQDVSATFELKVHQSGRIVQAFDQPLKAGADTPQQLSFSRGAGRGSVDISSLSGSIRVSSFGGATSPVAAPNPDGFDWSLVDNSKLSFAYLLPEAEFSSYRKVFIADVEVVFDPQWTREYSSEGYAKYQQRIRERYAENFKRALGEAMAASGKFELVKKREADALVLLPKVSHLYINTPEDKGIKETIITVAGRAALDMTVYSPRDKQVWAMFVDKRGTERLSAAESTLRTRLANEKSFTRLFELWSEVVAEYLDNASSATP